MQMTYYKTLFFLLFCFNVAWGQNFKAIYSLDYIFNENTPHKISKEKFTLLIYDTKESVFLSSPALHNDSLLKSMETLPYNNSGIFNIKSTLIKTHFQTIITKNYRNKSVKVYDTIFTLKGNYLFDEKLNWEIKDSSAKIGEYNCILAQVFYAGRNYEAWFTDEIPISDGPYFFFGLPGLIVDVSDARKNYHFKLLSFEKDYSKKIDNFYASKKSIQFDRTEFLNLRLSHHNDPIGFMANTLNIKGIDEDLQSDIKKNISKRNNFIELTW